jgi:putative membrane protein
MRMRVGHGWGALALAAGWLATGLARAHAPDPALVPADDWTLQPWLLALLLLAAGGYLRGVRRHRAAAGQGGGLGRRVVLAFAGGWLALLVALVSPLDAAGGRLLSAHLVQHQLLMVIAAPLLVMGRPLSAWSWAFEPPTRQWLAAASSARAWKACRQLLTDPVVAWGLQVVALWGWHLPDLFNAALRHEGWQLVQHATLLASALLFWCTVLGSGARATRGAGIAVASLVTTLLQTAALGALLSAAAVPWYEPYVATSHALGVDPMQDQQLGGLVLWLPAALAYAVAVLALLGRVLVRQRA